VGRTPWGLVAITRVQALEGRHDEALATLEEMKTLATSRYVSPALIAMGFQALGDKDQAFNWWAKACEDNSFDVKTLKLDPLNDGLRDDPRFADLLRKAKLGL
jgi:predicted negative regulator of RcsB-dependent stress response